MKEKIYQNRMNLLKAGAVGLLPLLCCIVTCAMQGKGIFDIYLPASEWNDELFYFKQVEAMLSHGYPRGYFGFNEGHALKLSFAAWSPVLVWPWLLWGMIFGWNLMSPILCNIAVMTIAVVVFVLLCKPSWKQTGLLALLFCTFTPFVNFMLRGMPEAICFAMVIVYYGLFCRQQEKEDGVSLVLLFVFAAVMTLMRPYLVLFLVYPVFCWFRRNKWSGIVGGIAIIGAVLGTYFAIKYYLGAEYFTPLFQTEWLTPFIEGHFWQGIKGVVGKLVSNGTWFMALTKEGFRSGIAEGAYFGGYLVMVVLFVWQASVSLYKKDSKKLIEYAYFAFCFVGMLIAILLMYKMKEGSKHLVTFMAMGIFVVAMMETRMYKKVVILAAVCVYLYSVKATSEVDYGLPFAYPQRVAQMEYWGEVFAEQLVLSEEKSISYDNTMIWVFSDEVKYEPVLTDWQILYALPEGFGINCCYGDYVIENFYSLKSKYITIPVGSELEKMCVNAGYLQIGSDECVSVYEVNKSYEQLMAEMHFEIEDRGANTLFLSSIPLSYDMEEDLWNYCLVNAVQGDFSMASDEEIYFALEELVNAHTISNLYMYLDVDIFSPENNTSELYYELFENAISFNTKIMLYAPSLDDMITMDEEEREWYYSLINHIVERLAIANVDVYFLGAQEWFVGNEKNYWSSGVIDSGHFVTIFFDMFFNEQYHVTPDNVNEQLVKMQELVRNRAEGVDRYATKGDVYVFFGDSIIGNENDSTSIPNVVANYSGKAVINAGIGGTRASCGSSNEVNGVGMVESFVGNGGVYKQEGLYASDEVLRWELQYANKVDVLKPTFFLGFGLNDYMSGSVLYGEKENSYEGALRYMVRLLKKRYPTAQIILLTPSYISYYEHGTVIVNEEGSVLNDYVDVVKQIGKEEDVIVFDVHNELGVDANNEKEYLVDMVHHTEKGRLIFGKYICKKMEELAYE